jgi:hypothetical protein
VILIFIDLLNEFEFFILSFEQTVASTVAEEVGMKLGEEVVYTI